ncbi:copper homeostasis protein CutC [Microbacterium paludicola]|uniref:copper homeostasis protein CutC n=1 Tax=Microbacterium paludicola TaxID=300019 RepID=UPI0011A6612C|nr:copper homeostasis protein CutC [Microbacterium paludicola]
MMRLEIAVQDPAGARAAFANGADRIELCQALGATGGLTPSAGTVEAALDVAGSAERVAVLVRPRPGGFVYDAEEIAVVTADIRDLVARGVGGVVVGALTADGALDTEAMSRWSDAAGDADVVLHRAIDTLREPADVIDVLASLGVRRVLTSGGAARSIDGLATLRSLVERSADRVEIMAGGGVRVQDIPAIAAVGVHAVHLSARTASDDAAPSGPGGGAVGYDITDPHTVAAAAAALTDA